MMDAGLGALDTLAREAARLVENALTEQNRLEAEVERRRGLFSEGLILVHGNLQATYMHETADDLMKAVDNLRMAVAIHEERVAAHGRLESAFYRVRDGA
jgi:hypothetical protein